MKKLAKGVLTALAMAAVALATGPTKADWTYTQTSKACSRDVPSACTQVPGNTCVEDGCWNEDPFDPPHLAKEADPNTYYYLLLLPPLVRAGFGRAWVQDVRRRGLRPVSPAADVAAL